VRKAAKVLGIPLGAEATTIIGAPQLRQMKSGARPSGIGGSGSGSGYDIQSRADPREARAAHRVGKQAVVTDAMETAMGAP
jgi:hypothetical protein